MKKFERKKKRKKAKVLKDFEKSLQVPQCPKCESKKISVYLDDEEKGFKCLDCNFK